MSDGEHKLVDASGDFRYVVRDGEPVDSPPWRSCRIVLTSERLVLATSDGEQAVALGNVSLSEDPEAVVPDGVSAGDGTPLRIGDAVLQVDAGSVEDFAAEYRRAVLHDAVILARPEAVVAGVVSEDAAWSEARFRFDGDRVVLGLPGGRTFRLDIEGVGTIERRRATVRDADRAVVAVEHTDREGRSVETHFSGTERHVRALSALLRAVIEAREGEVDLTETERQVLVALYSGVSPFEMADFVGIDADEVAEIYHKLVDVGAVDEIRERAEITLTARGRTLASEAMNEQ
jgi:helix-turn-helix protein